MVGAVAMRFLLGDDSSGSITAFEMTVPGGKRLPAPAYSHEHYEETIYGISGVLNLTSDGKTFAVGPGEAVCIPRGAVHRFDNDTAQDAKTLCGITPAKTEMQQMSFHSKPYPFPALPNPPLRRRMTEFSVRKRAKATATQDNRNSKGRGGRG